MLGKLFADRTILHLSTHLANKYTFTQIRDLFIDLKLSSYDKIDELMHPPMSKNNLCMTILNEENIDTNDIIFDELLKRTIKGAKNELKQALELDGWDITDYGVASLAGELAEPSVEHNVLIDMLNNRGMSDIVSYLKQSFDNYTDQNYESANAMIRTALEAIVGKTAELVSQDRHETIPRNNPHHHQPADHRKYLKNSGFLDNQEYELLTKTYSYCSTDGSHPGLSDQTDARLRRFFIVGICLFYLEKLESRGL